MADGPKPSAFICLKRRARSCNSRFWSLVLTRAFTDPSRSPGLLFVLGRHARRRQRREHRAELSAGWGLEFSRRGIAAGRLQNGLGRDVFSHGVDDAAVATTKIGGPPALRTPGRDLVFSRVRLVGQRVVIRNAVGSGHTTWPVGVVEFL